MLGGVKILDRFICNESNVPQQLNSWFCDFVKDTTPALSSIHFLELVRGSEYVSLVMSDYDPFTISHFVIYTWYDNMVYVLGVITFQEADDLNGYILIEQLHQNIQSDTADVVDDTPVDNVVEPFYFPLVFKEQLNKFEMSPLMSSPLVLYNKLDWLFKCIAVKCLCG